MTYSVESLLFRVAAGVVNTAARAANSLLEVMYPPRYDTAHIWDEPEQSPHEAAASADPPPADVADPAGGTPPPPAGSPLTWRGWAVPAICDVLSEFMPSDDEISDSWAAAEWRDNVSEIIADRIACDPTRAALALTSLQTQ